MGRRLLPANPANRDGNHPALTRLQRKFDTLFRTVAAAVQTDDAMPDLIGLIVKPDDGISLYHPAPVRYLNRKDETGLQCGAGGEKFRLAPLSLRQQPGSRPDILQARRNLISEEIHHVKSGKIQRHTCFFLIVPDCGDQFSVPAVDVADHAGRKTVLRHHLRPFKQTGQCVAGDKIGGWNQLADVIEITRIPPQHILLNGD